MKLCDIYGYDYPNRDEIIWEYVGMNEFDTVDFPVVDINPVEIFNTWTIDGMHLFKDVMKQNATREQKRLINQYRKNIDAIKESIVVVCLDLKVVIDGYHRIAAMALEKEEHMKALNISEEE